MTAVGYKNKTTILVEKVFVGLPGVSPGSRAFIPDVYIRSHLCMEKIIN